VAQSYARVFSLAADMVVPRLVAAVRAGSDIKALELCYGLGNVTAGLVAESSSMTGLDFSPAMLEMARLAAPKAHFIEGDAMSLIFGAATFDAVTIGFGMPHMPDPP
jgi:ubiquinone/menaquinone biosynthesis C-methylase UbiE